MRAGADQYEAPFRPLVGQVLGRYRVIEKIGSGGMGVVYRAHDERLKRDVALKILPEGTLDDTRRKHFRKEALILSHLNHPNIETAHDFESANSVDFLVMEFVPGVTLDRKLEDGHLPEKEITQLGMQLAQGLRAAHAEGIIHRDLKPKNLRITEDGRLKILDFGLAKSIAPSDPCASTESVSENQHLVGTIAYMAPEQLRCEQVDARADIYAAGSVLYEMTTGRRVFTEEGPRLVDAILHQEPIPPRTINPQISSGLEAIILKALDKDPEHRYQSARELLVDLERLTASARLVYASRSRGHARKVRLYAALGLLFITATTLFAVFALRPKQEKIDSIAVMPFVNTNADPNTEYLGDGITESLINEMSHISNLKVISRASVFHYKGTDVDPQRVAHDLGVHAVLTGRFAQRGDSLLISAELVDARDNMHLWGEQYSRKLADLPAIQEEISRGITRKLRPRLTTSEREHLAAGGTTDAEAYRLYIKGRYFWNKRDVEGLKKARDYFQQAIERDPNYALAYTGLADSYALLGDALSEVLNREELRKEGCQKAIAASKKALEIDDTLGEAHASYAYALFDSSDFSGAEKEFKRALELNPNYANAHHWYANLLLCLGRQEEGLTEIRRAQQLDPLSLIINTWVGEHLFAMNRVDEAIEQYKKVLEMDPNFIQAHSNLAEAYDVKGMHSQAIDEYEVGIFHTPQSDAKTAAEAVQLRRAYRSSGARGYWLQKLQFAKSNQDYAGIAVFYDLLGDKENAIKALQKVTPDENWYLLINGPYLEDLRSDPRFQDQVRRVREFYKGGNQ
ncbi:MAG: hypothetical protein JWO20_207 [Candidatus Angelobacter sp.]|nr:hypothetical protein [Candidatus Angelobacter sp.]